MNLLWESSTDVDAVVLADGVGAEASRLSLEGTCVSSTMIAPTYAFLASGELALYHQQLL